jgi:hypothetical protein
MADRGLGPLVASAACVRRGAARWVQRAAPLAGVVAALLVIAGVPSASAASLPGTPEFPAPFLSAHAAGKKHRHKPRHKSPVHKYTTRARPSTTTLAPRAVKKVSPTGPSGSLVTLAPGAHVPAIGHGLVVNPSPSAPKGVVGIVTGVSRHGGHTTVKLRQAALSEVFSSYEVNASGSLGEAASATAARASTARLVTGHLASLGPLTPHWKCSGSAPTPHITVDLSQVHYALSVKIPDYIQVFVGGPMKFSVGLQFSAAASCTGSLVAQIPIGDTGLFIEIGPEFSVHAGGAASASFTWEPRVTYAFFRSSTGSGNYDIHELKNSSSVDFAGAAEVSTNLGLQLGLNAFGRVGVTGTLGPTLTAKLQDANGQSCRIIEGDAEADLTAYAHVWFADWTFDLANLVFWKHEFARSCGSTGGGSGGPGGGSPGPGGPGGPKGGGGPPGAGWALQPLPGISATQSGLAGVSCVSGSWCLAVGGAEGATLTEIWNGSSWTHEPTANVGTPAGVSCVSTAWCMAVGAEHAARWTGSNWESVPLPTVGGAESTSFISDSCTSTTFCIAAGQANFSGGEFTPITAKWNGTTWSLLTTPSPTGSVNTDLVSVSCPAENSCTAVGGYDNDEGIFTGEAYAEHWNGSAWTIQTTPNPGSGIYSGLNSVSCPTTTSCVAVGYWDQGLGTSPVPLAEQWNGSSWASTGAVLPAGAEAGETAYVSCASSTSACEAAGQFYAGGGAASLAEGWNGTSWTVQSTPNPSGAVDSYFDGISCSSSTACVADGSAFLSAGSTAFAESYSGS